MLTSNLTRGHMGEDIELPIWGSQAGVVRSGVVIMQFFSSSGGWSPSEGPYITLRGLWLWCLSSCRLPIWGMGVVWLGLVWSGMYAVMPR
jgi:hypothetical protein